MFRGLSKITLDTKGRMAIPSRYRDRIISRSEGQLILTVDRRDTCLLLYPLPDWEEIERKLERRWRRWGFEKQAKASAGA